VRAKHWLFVAAAALCLHGSAIGAHAGSGGSDWVWMGPLIAAGAIGVGYVIIRMVDDPPDDDAPGPAGARPPRQTLRQTGAQPVPRASDEPRILWDVRRCSRGTTYSLACW